MKSKQKKTPLPTTSLVHVVRQNAKTCPHKTFLRWVNARSEVVNEITYESLWTQSAAVAELLRRNGVVQGDRVMISYPQGIDFVVGLFGCMRMGALPCSVYPPNLAKTKARHSFKQFNNQVKDAGAHCALTTARFRFLLRTSQLKGPTTAVKWLATDNLKCPTNLEIDEYAFLSPEDIAFIQYSSGSTGDPKGIMISHGAVLYNVGAMRDELMAVVCNEHIGVTWLPQYHDYSLVEFAIMPLVHRDVATYMASPIDFIKNPLLWADMMDMFQPTFTAGPNFSYSLLAKRMKSAGRQLNTKQLVNASIAAEPINPSTLEKMVEMGIPKESVCPAYGFAETTVFFGPCLSHEIEVVDGVVSCVTLRRCEAARKFAVIADPSSGVIVDEGVVSEIFVRGPDLASGYWGKPELTKQAFKNRLEDGNEYFRTGDLGMIVNGRLFVVGRAKEVIIVNGRNVYPSDIERTLESAFPEIIRPGSTVAFQHGEDSAGIVLELRKTVNLETVSTKLTAQSLRRLTNDAHGIDTQTIILLKQGTVPKTTSGKLKRLEARRMSLEDEWNDRSLVWKWNRNEVEEVITCHLNEGEGPADSTKDDDVINQIFESFLGKGFDWHASWDENGLSSVAQAELASQINEKVFVQIPANFPSKFPTPIELKAFVQKQTGTGFPVDLPVLQAEGARPLQLYLLVVLEGLGVLTHFIFFALACFSAYYVGKAAVPLQSAFEVGNSGRYVVWSWLQIILPTFMVSLSLLVVVAKWIVVGRYSRDREIKVGSLSYVRWWFIDRLMHLWEQWVGVFILNTPMLWLFYRLLGAKIHPRTEIKDFVREFDLVTIGKDTKVSQQIRCRRFGPWKDEAGPTLRFRPVSIGERCLIEGMVSLGSTVHHAVDVAKLSVLQEGAQVATNTLACGNPAFGKSKTKSQQSPVSYFLQAMKTAWLFVELYIFFGLLLVAQVVWNGRLPDTFRYAPLLHWILLITTTSFLSLITSAAMKWVLIGRARSGEEKVGRRSLWAGFAEWACDYHFGASATIPYALSGMSRVWNFILMLHGLNIDVKSAIVHPYSLPPSKVDQLKIRRSFLSCHLTFRPGSTIEIVDSTVGFRAILSSGLQVYRSTIRTYGEVTESMYDDNPYPVEQNYGQIMFHEVIGIIRFILGCLTFVPSYEVFQSIPSETSLASSLPLVIVAVLVQCLTWFAFLYLIQAVSIVLNQTSRISQWISDSWYHMYIHTVWPISTWGFWFLFWGTPYYNTLLKVIGAKVEGDLLFNGAFQYDFPSLVFKDKTIVDDCQTTGHYQVGNKLVVGRSVHSGVLHEGCFTIAGTSMNGDHSMESGPWKAVIGKEEGSVLTACSSTASHDHIRTATTTPRCSLSFSDA